MSVEARRRGHQPHVDSFDDVFEVFDDVFETVPWGRAAQRRAVPPQRSPRTPERVSREQPTASEQGATRPKPATRERLADQRTKDQRQGDQRHRDQRQGDRHGDQRRSARARPAPRAKRRPEREAPSLPLPKAAFVVAVVGLIVAGLVGVLVLRTKINENSLRLGDLRQSQQALSLQEQELEQQIADLSAPGNLLDAAERLGLVDAGTPAYLSLPDGRVVGVPQPAGETTPDEKDEADGGATPSSTVDASAER